jgi:hypothetical protein
MPPIDLSFITLEPIICAIPFRMHRRRETVDAHGRSAASTEVFDAIGGVYPTGAKALVRDLERDFRERGVTSHPHAAAD